MKKYFLLFFSAVVFFSCSENAFAVPNANIFNDDVFAYHTHLMNMTPLDVQPVNDGAAMPSGLFILPGRYKAYGQTYDMTAPGLYRFFNYTDSTTVQRVVYSQTDPMPVISAMQWIFTQSYTDNALNNTQLTNIAKYDKLRISCGKAVAYMTWLMPQFGYPARYAGAITHEEWNTINDGHAMVEIYMNGKWVLFDLAFNARFWRDGQPLNLYEVASDLDTVEIEYMTFDTSYDVSGLYYKGRSLSALMEPMTSPVLLRDFYRRHLDALLIMDGTKYYYYDAGPNDAQFQLWGYVKLTQAEWLERFYP